MQGVLTNTLAALGYFLVSCLPQPIFYSLSFPLTFSSQEIIHIVSSNETITGLAYQYYGSQEYWTNIWLNNPQINNPNSLPVGTNVVVSTEQPLLIKKLPSEKMPSFSNQSAAAIDQVNFSAQIETEVISPTPVLVSSNFDEVYKQAGEKYGVPWQVLYGLHLTETGLRDGSISNGQGSGAQGPMQFMPQTWRTYGVDGNGDGVVDINNATDAIYGAANYLAKHGGVEQGLHYYGGNTKGTLAAARARGYGE
jgi:hypothetical protein